jgi:hypothetical protein
MVGKYSPTVSEAYSQDQNWFEKYAGCDKDGLQNYIDPEGYDEWGYNKNNIQSRSFGTSIQRSL